MMEEINVVLDAIALYQKQYDQVDKLWSYFSVVSLAVAGFVIGSERATRTMKEPIAIVCAYLVFCIGNHTALIAGQKQLEQLYQIAQSFAFEQSFNILTLKPISAQKVSIFHICVMAAFSIGILIVAKLRIKSRNIKNEARQ